MPVRSPPLPASTVRVLPLPAPDSLRQASWLSDISSVSAAPFPEPILPPAGLGVVLLPVESQQVPALIGKVARPIIPAYPCFGADLQRELEHMYAAKSTRFAPSNLTKKSRYSKLYTLLNDQVAGRDEPLGQAAGLRRLARRRLVGRPVPPLRPGAAAAHLQGGWVTDGWLNSAGCRCKSLALCRSGAGPLLWGAQQHVGAT